MPSGDRHHIRTTRERVRATEKEANRRQADRRIEKSRGYTYISMVGWMDRREKKRRRDDGVDPW